MNRVVTIDPPKGEYTYVYATGYISENLKVTGIHVMYTNIR